MPCDLKWYKIKIQIFTNNTRNKMAEILPRHPTDLHAQILLPR